MLRRQYKTAQKVKTLVDSWFTLVTQSNIIEVEFGPKSFCMNLLIYLPTKIRSKTHPRQ